MAVITINGTNFTPSTVALFQGSPRVTTYVSATQIQMTLLPEDTVDPGQFEITVLNIGVGESAAATLTVNDIPTPTISTLNPDPVTEDLGPETIVVTGTGFLPTSVVTFEGADRVTTYVNSTELSVALLAADTQTVGAFDMQVRNTPTELSNIVQLDVDSAAPSFTREVFLDDSRTFFNGFNQWIVPVGVTSIDILAVAQGGTAGQSTDTLEFFAFPGGGGGGGGVLVVTGVPVTPGEGLDIFGTSGLVRRVVGGDVLAQAGLGGFGESGFAGAPADGSAGTANDAPNGGTVAAGSRGGGGGGGGFNDGGPGTGGAGANSAGNGGNSSNIGPTALDFADGSGGGGGAGGNGTNGVSAASPGNGGPGIIPPDHTFGPWGTDIGETGYFGGGGPGAALDISAPVPVGNPGIGSGAANTGGGGGFDSSGNPLAGYIGIVAIVYENP